MQFNTSAKVQIDPALFAAVWTLSGAATCMSISKSIGRQCTKSLSNTLAPHLHAPVVCGSLCKMSPWCTYVIWLMWGEPPACSEPQRKNSSPEAGEIEDGEIAEQPAAPAVIANNAVSVPAAGKRKAVDNAAPAAKAPLQFKMSDLQRAKAQQSPNQRALQQAPLPAFTDIVSPEQHATSASNAPAPSRSLAASGAQEAVAPQPRLHHSVHNSQHSQPASKASDARRTTQHSTGRSKHADPHERVQPNARTQSGTAESAPHRSARSRSRGAPSHKQQIASPPRHSNTEREPSAHMPEQPRGSAAQRAQLEMAPMVSDIEKLLSSVSLQTIRKCVTGHLLLWFGCTQPSL